MNNEKEFKKPEAQVIAFEPEDIILTSDLDVDSDQIG